MRYSTVKRVISGILTGILLLSCLVGCSSNKLNQVQVVDKDVQEQVELTFFGNKADESNVHVIEKIIREFMEEHPNIIVTYESIKGTAYYDTLKKRMENKSGDDIFMIDHDTMLTLHKNGQVADLSDLSTINLYSAEEKRQFVSTDGIYWIPTTVSAFGLYCNMDMLEQYGQNVPTNLHELEAVCDYFLEKGITPIVADNDISLKTIAIGASYYDIYQNSDEKRWFADLNAGKTAFGESLSDGLAIVDEIIQKGYVNAEDTLETEKTSGDLEIFATNQNPFMLTGVWASNRLKSDYHVTFNYEVHPLPILEDGSLIVINPDTRLAVNADSEHLKEAKMFVEYFTQTENLQAFCDDQCSISPLENGISSSAAEIQPIVQCYEDGRSVIGADARLKLPIWSLTKDASRELLNKKPLSAVIDELDQQASEYTEIDEGTHE